MTEQLTKGIFTLEYKSKGEREGFDDYILGNAYAFYKGTDPQLQKIYFLGKPAELGAQNNRLSSTPNSLAPPTLAAVVTDKALYKEGDDTVRILAFAPSLAGEHAQVKIELNGAELTTIKIPLGQNGLGLFELPDPIAGNYELHFLESTANFTSAAYQLAPLTARFERFELKEADGAESLYFSVKLDSYGAPYAGQIALTVQDLGNSPPTSGDTTTLMTNDGSIKGQLKLKGQGPFSLMLQCKQDAAKTASLPVPGSRQEERQALRLSDWGLKHEVRAVPFEGAEPRRGLFLSQSQSSSSTSPFRLVRVDDNELELKARAEINHWHVAIFDPLTQELTERTGEKLDLGESITLKLSSPWALIFAGAETLGAFWEGSATVLRPDQHKLKLEIQPECRPGDKVSLNIEGPGGASVFVLVKDQRLQVPDTPVSSTAASLKRQLVFSTGRCGDSRQNRTLQTIIPPESPPMPVMRFAAVPMQMAMPPPAPGGPAFAVPEGAAMMDAGGMPDALAPEALNAEDPGDAPRSDFPEVLVAKIIELDASGKTTLDFKAGDAMGTMSVEAFAVLGHDFCAASQTLLIQKPLFGELYLPRFVKAGDFAQGKLYVRVSTGEATVSVARDNTSLTIATKDDEGQTLTIGAPGETVTFGAIPGKYMATVQNAEERDCSEGQVDEPGKLVWLQKAVRVLQKGERADGEEPGVLTLRVLPNLDEVFDRMVGGLRSYEHCCCEQTSAVMLAAAAAYLTAQDETAKREAANHVRACVARERSMYLKGRGFKGWPEYPDEVFCYSPGATLNLLQMSMLEDLPDGTAELREAIAECLEMARDAAEAHGIQTAPENPKSAREAYGRFAEFTRDRQRMAEFIRERIEPWEKEMKAILKFELPSLTTETYHRSPAMIRAETAFGAATLIESGGALQVQGLQLANTVLAAVQENGSMYSTLDSVAAITLLTAMRNARLSANDDTELMLNGQISTLGEAVAHKDIQSIEAIDTPIQVEVQRVVEEDYTAINQGVVAQVWLQRDKRKTSKLKLGDTVELVIELSDYQEGDLVHVFLPDALSWVFGGGQVKKFSLDLMGKTKLAVPLAATGPTLNKDGEFAPQHFAVCVRNMYDEERGAGFGDLSVLVGEGADEGITAKVWRGLKSMFES